VEWTELELNVRLRGWYKTQHHWENLTSQTLICTMVSAASLCVLCTMPLGNRHTEQSAIWGKTWRRFQSWCSDSGKTLQLSTTQLCMSVCVYECVAKWCICLQQFVILWIKHERQIPCFFVVVVITIRYDYSFKLTYHGK